MSLLHELNFLCVINENEILKSISFVPSFYNNIVADRIGVDKSKFIDRAEVQQLLRHK
jgi:hypothetical protein